MTLSGAIIPGQSVPENTSNERVLHITQSTRTGDLQSDGLMSYPGPLVVVVVIGILTLCKEAVGVFYSHN